VRQAARNVVVAEVGDPRGGIARYGRTIATGLGPLVAGSVTQASVDLSGEGPRGVRQAWRAARRLSRDGVVVLPYSPWLWSPARRWRLLQALAVHAGGRGRLLLDLHDVEAPPTRRSRPDVEQLLLRTHLGLARATVVHTEEDLRRVRRLAGRRPPAVVEHYVEPRHLPDRREARAAYGLTEGDRVVALLGFVNLRKNHLLLVRALPALPEHVQVWFLGGAAPGDEHVVQDLWDAAEALGVSERLHLTGYLPDEELDRRLAACDVAVLPYADASASGSLATLLGAGLRVVASDLPTVRAHQALAPLAVHVLTRLDPTSLATALVTALDAPVDLEGAFDVLLERRSVRAAAGHYAALLGLPLHDAGPA
jgi:glycosyltransferase involved in cell wall biosynthesis